MGSHNYSSSIGWNAMEPLKKNYSYLHLLTWKEVHAIPVHCRTQVCMCVCVCDRNMCKDAYQNIHSGYLQLKDVWEFLYIFLLFIFTMDI